MKKFIIILLAMVFMSSMVYAGDWKGLFIKKDDPTMKQVVPPDFNTILGSLPFNLNGDTVYLTSNDSFGAGVGLDLATYKGLITLRAETLGTTTSDVFAGVGLMLNVPTLFTMLGAEWNASYINPSIGVVPGYNFGTKKGDVGIVLSIIQVTF